MFRAASRMRSTFRPLLQALGCISQSSSAQTEVPVDLVASVHPNPIVPPFSILSPSLSCSQVRHRHVDGLNRDPASPPKLFVVQPRLRPDTILKTKLDEALNLANSLEVQRDGFFDTEFSEKELPPHVVVQNPIARSPHADTYFGPGTVETVKIHINNTEETDAVFVNAILTGIQQRNLERAWGKPVLDRVGLIIEIFHAHAQTKEAKLQAELAALMYKRSRLVRIRGADGRYTFGAKGEAEVVSARGRGSGGRGFISGAGETEIQLQRRRILDRRNQLLSEIKEVRRTRALQRAARKRHGSLHGQDLATVAIVGYTNAGKSTLVSALSGTYLFSDDRMFATVDPKLRSVVLPLGKKVLLSDTVGFISELPVQLVDAFHATLEEVVEADLLVHVVDSSATDRDEQRATVLQVLRQIGVSEEKLCNMIEVWNKIDLEESEIAADKYDEEKEFSNYSHAEDLGMESEELPGESLGESDEEEEDDVVSVSENMKEGDYSDGWLSSGDGEVTWDYQNGSFVGWKTAGSNSAAQLSSFPHVRTSALTGVGLQELLQLIDDKLKGDTVEEKNVFDRKWRPPRVEDAGIAVGQLLCKI